LKPINYTEFGHYLAGLIAVDGYIHLKYIAISFHSSDDSIAYYLKSRLDYRQVSKKNKKAIIFVIRKKEGIYKILSLINEKLRTEHKLNQVNRILNNTILNNFDLNYTQDLNNYWLAGFSYAYASFQIILNRKDRKKPEIRLSFQVDQKKDIILNLIKIFLVGNLGYRKTQDTYYYSSTSFG